MVHQADPVTLTRKNGTKRTILVVTDERAGAAASAECPGGGLHLFDITGAKERNPEKMGTWFIPKVQPQDGATCTSHVLRIYPKQKLMTIAWYSQGVRVLDISGLARFQGTPASVGIGDGVGMKEIGHYVMPDSDTWSFKTNKIRRDGSFFGYGNDLVRGFDVYRFNGRPIGDVPPSPRRTSSPPRRPPTPRRGGWGAPPSSAPPCCSPGSCAAGPSYRGPDTRRLTPRRGSLGEAVHWGPPQAPREVTRHVLGQTRRDPYPAKPTAAVVVLHGGGARRGQMAVSPTQLSVLRMVPIAQRIAWPDAATSPSSGC